MKFNENNLIKKNKISSRQKLLLVFMTLSMIPLFFAARSVFTVFAQTGNRQEREIRQLSFDNEPVEMVSIGNSRKRLKLDEKFTQETDWLKDLSVEIRNTSDKNIVYFEVGLDFPETKDSGNKMSFPIRYGVSPLSKVRNDKEQLIKSGESITLRLTSEKYEVLKSFIETRHLLDSLSKVDLRISFILFDDGTAWGGGNFLRSDPNDKRKFILKDSNK